MGRHKRRTRIALVVFVATSLAFLHGAAFSTPSDPYRDKQWALDRIEVQGAWDEETGDGVTIAIVDTGIDVDHPDLESKIDTRPGSDMVDRAQCGRRAANCHHDGPLDYNGHGTHVAGIAAAASQNGIGIAGVAPDARILPVRVLDADGGGTARWVAKGIRFAADHDADVINLSLGVTSGADKALRVTGKLNPIYRAINYASQDAVLVVAAGNDTFPLCAEPSAHPRVVCVGATDRHDVRSSYSNSDATMSSDYLVAPGGRAAECGSDVYSTYLTWSEWKCGDEKGYEALAGTSMAAPHVSGVAALLVDQGLNTEEARRCLVRTTDDLGPPGRDSLYGFGRLNAREALTGC